jgi:hypothetical protein
VLIVAALFGTTGTAKALGPASTTALGVGAVRPTVGGLALSRRCPRTPGRLLRCRRQQLAPLLRRGSLGQGLVEDVEPGLCLLRGDGERGHHMQPVEVDEREEPPPGAGGDDGAHLRA